MTKPFSFFRGKMGLFCWVVTDHDLQEEAGARSSLMTASPGPRDHTQGEGKPYIPTLGFYSLIHIYLQINQWPHICNSHT